MIDVVAAEKNGTERPVLGTVSCVSVQEVTESPMYVRTYHIEEPLCMWKLGNSEHVLFSSMPVWEKYYADIQMVASMTTDERV